MTNFEEELKRHLLSHLARNAGGLILQDIQDRILWSKVIPEFEEIPTWQARFQISAALETLRCNHEVHFEIDEKTDTRRYFMS